MIFLKTAQGNLAENIKANLGEDKVLVTLDFSENYTSKIQDAIQSYHWASRQAKSILTFHICKRMNKFVKTIL